MNPKSIPLDKPIDLSNFNTLTEIENLDVCPICKEEIEWRKRNGEFSLIGQCKCPPIYSDDATYSSWEMRFGKVTINRNIIND